MAEAAHTVTTKQLREEIRGVLSALYAAAKAGNRTRLSEAGSLIKIPLSLDFVDYFKFLRRYNYVAIDRTDQSLELTNEGKSIVDQGPDDEFNKDMSQHFARFINDDEEQLIDLSEDTGEQKLPTEGSGEEAPFPPVAPASGGTARAGWVEQKEVKTEAKPEARADSRPEVKAAAADPRKDGVPYPMGGKTEPKYVRYEAIGSGGIGTVYRARHSSLALDLAIKEIKDLFSYFNFLQRSEVVKHFREVVGQMALLNHPLIVRVLDQNADVAHPFFVMEMLPGGNLRQLIAKGPIPVERALICFLQICYALQAAHQASVIHGNLKPENILFDAQGNVRVADFGMTRLLQTDSDRPVPQVVTGTLGYLSPEQMRPGGQPSLLSDIYSLGIMFYEMLTGNLPGRRSPLPSEVNKELTKDLDTLFDKMTRDRPEERYPDVGAVLTDFYNFHKDGRYLKSGRIILLAAAP